MALVVKRNRIARGDGYTELEKLYNTSDPNTQIVVTTLLDTIPPLRPRKLLFIAVRYSAGPAHGGVTVDLNGDIRIFTGAANAQNNVFIPDGEVILADDDTVNVTAPAGGGVITSEVHVAVEAM